jgi:hypothetical protein
MYHSFLSYSVSLRIFYESFTSVSFEDLFVISVHISLSYLRYEGYIEINGFSGAAFLNQLAICSLRLVP